MQLILVTSDLVTNHTGPVTLDSFQGRAREWIEWAPSVLFEDVDGTQQVLKKRDVEKKQP